MGKGNRRMPTNLEKEICREYKVKPKKISDTKILQLMELIILHIIY